MDPVLPANEGVYKCVPTNIVGTGPEATIFLKVEGTLMLYFSLCFEEGPFLKYTLLKLIFNKFLGMQIGFLHTAILSHNCFRFNIPLQSLAKMACRIMLVLIGISMW